MKNPSPQFDPKKEYEDTLQKLISVKVEQDEFLTVYRKAIDEARIKKIRAALYEE